MVTVRVANPRQFMSACCSQGTETETSGCSVLSWVELEDEATYGITWEYCSLLHLLNILIWCKNDVAMATITKLSQYFSVKLEKNSNSFRLKICPVAKITKWQSSTSKTNSVNQPAFDVEKFKASEQSPWCHVSCCCHVDNLFRLLFTLSYNIRPIWLPTTYAVWRKVVFSAVSVRLCTGSGGPCPMMQWDRQGTSPDRTNQRTRKDFAPPPPPNHWDPFPEGDGIPGRVPPGRTEVPPPPKQKDEKGAGGVVDMPPERFSSLSVLH